MNRNERDERLVAAAEAQAVAARELTDALSAPERRREQEALSAAFPQARLLFGGERGAVALLRGIPGFAQLWDRSVPDGYLDRVRSRDGALWWIVNCPCGEHPALLPGAIGDCACERWYFATGESVRVKRFEPEAVAA